MSEFSSRKIVLHQFNVEKNEGESGIGYYTIIVIYLTVQIGLVADFKRRVLEWDKTAVRTKESGNLLGEHNSTKCKIQEVSMNTEESASTI